MNTKCKKICGNDKKCPIQNKYKIINMECKKIYENDKEMPDAKQIQDNEYGM